MRKKRATSQEKTDRPLQLHEERELPSPSCRQKKTSSLSRQGKEILTTPFTSSKDGREHTFKKKRGAPHNLQTKKTGPPARLCKTSTSCTKTRKDVLPTYFWSERELLYKNSLISWYCKSPSPLKRMEGSSLLVKEDKL